MKTKHILYSLLAIVVLFFSFKLYDKYKEKNFADEMNYNPSSFESLTFSDKKSLAWREDTKEPVETLMNYLNNYQIKKNDKCTFYSTKGFEFTIRSKDGKEKYVSIFNNCAYIMDYGLVEIVNGPVDMSWVQKFNKAYEK